MRDGVRNALSEEADLAVAGEAENGPAVFRRVREETWDLVR